jgi:hypothetical protein
MVGVWQHFHSELLWFWTSAIALYSKELENTTFQKLGLFLSLGEDETPTLLGPLERGNLSQSSLKTQ